MQATLFVSQTTKPSQPLDKLGHHNLNQDFDILERKGESVQDKIWAKRGYKTYISDKIKRSLIKFGSEKMNKSYYQSLKCNKIIDVRDGIGRSETYCKQRWCVTCNNIYTANLINGYYKVIEKEFKSPHFLTITRPNVKADELQAEIKHYRKTLNTIIKTGKKHANTLIYNSFSKTNFKAICKLEVTYNHKSDTYHPHIHILLSNAISGNYIKNEWLKHNPTANEKAQDLRPANSQTLKELFKYATKIATKITTKDGEFIDNQAFIKRIKGLDVIFSTLKNTRILTTYNLKKLDVKKMQDEESNTQLTDNEEVTPSNTHSDGYYSFINGVWCNANGEAFGLMRPSAKVQAKMLKFAEFLE